MVLISGSCTLARWNSDITKLWLSWFGPSSKVHLVTAALELEPSVITTLWGELLDAVEPPNDTPPRLSPVSESAAASSTLCSAHCAMTLLRLVACCSAQSRLCLGKATFIACTIFLQHNLRLFFVWTAQKMEKQRSPSDEVIGWERILMATSARAPTWRSYILQQRVGIILCVARSSFFAKTTASLLKSPSSRSNMSNCRRMVCCCNASPGHHLLTRLVKPCRSSGSSHFEVEVHGCSRYAEACNSFWITLPPTSEDLWCP